LYFAELLNAKSLLILDGEKGSGKTILANKIGWTVRGSKFSVAILSRKQEDLETLLTSDTLVCLDDLDEPRLVRKYLLLLCQAVTGGQIVKRRLYSDHTRVAHPRLTENRDFGDVGDDFRAEKTSDVPERVFGEGRGTVTEPVTGEVIVDDLLKNPDTVLPNLFNVVVASFECFPVLPLSVFRDGSRCRFFRFIDSLAGEAKPVPPILSSLIGCHSGLLSCR
jgi:hypothetical protein